MAEVICGNPPKSGRDESSSEPGQVMFKHPAAPQLPVNDAFTNRLTVTNTPGANFYVTGSNLGFITGKSYRVKEAPTMT